MSWHGSIGLIHHETWGCYCVHGLPGRVDDQYDLGMHINTHFATRDFLEPCSLMSIFLYHPLPILFLAVAEIFLHLCDFIKNINWHSKLLSIKRVQEWMFSIHSSHAIFLRIWKLHHILSVVVWEVTQPNPLEIQASNILQESTNMQWPFSVYACVKCSKLSKAVNVGQSCDWQEIV